MASHRMSPLDILRDVLCRFINNDGVQFGSSDGFGVTPQGVERHPLSEGVELQAALVSGTLTRVASGGNLPLSAVIMSRLRTQSPGKMQHKMYETTRFSRNQRLFFMQRMLSVEYTLHLAHTLLVHADWCM